MSSKYDIEPYDPCPCGSGAKYKFCCAAKAKDIRHGKFPMGTVAYYGPDDKITTKIAAGVIVHEDAEPTLRRWNGEGVRQDAKIAEEIKQFFAKHGVKNVVVTDGNLGCPHEEGIDFSMGADCPECPFWAGKQGTARRNSETSPWTIEPYDEDAEDDDDLEDEDLEDEADADDLDDEEQDWDAAFERVEKILGAAKLDFDQAVSILRDHLKQNLSFPCEVTGSEDFSWEEPYVIGGWSQGEYKRLKKSQPSYTDRYQLLAIGEDEWSEWMMFLDEDIPVRVKRISDSREFVLGLAELKATDRKSPNYQLLDDYAVWFVNSR